MYPSRFLQEREESTQEYGNILRYINFLYGIELLRNSNVANVDQMTAWQYGQFFQTPWKDNDVLVYKFLEEHKTDLYAFNIQKLMRLTKKLLAELDNFKSSIYVKVALDPHTAKSLSAGLQEAVTDNNIMRSFMSEARVNDHVNSSQPHMIRHYRGAMMGIEVADRVLCGVFDEWTQNRPLLNTDAAKDTYGADRQDVLDNRIYACTCWMRRQIQEALSITCYDLTFRRVFALYSNFFHLYASLFSIMFRMVVPVGMHPDRLSNLYDKYVTTHTDYHKYLCKTRKMSGLTVETVADDTIPRINKRYLEDTVLAESNPLHTHRFLFTATYPDSLVEKYVMTQCLVEKEV